MSKTVFGVLAILFNWAGVPCFIQGKVGKGILHIILSCVTCGVAWLIYFIKGIILGVKVFKMTDEEFAAQLGNL